MKKLNDSTRNQSSRYATDFRTSWGKELITLYHQMSFKYYRSTYRLMLFKCLVQHASLLSAFQLLGTTSRDLSSCIGSCLIIAKQQQLHGLQIDCGVFAPSSESNGIIVTTREAMVRLAVAKGLLPCQVRGHIVDPFLTIRDEEQQTPKEFCCRRLN